MPRESNYPLRSKELREHWIVERDQCPECGGSLDTGYECNNCGYDAKPERDNLLKASKPP